MGFWGQGSIHPWGQRPEEGEFYCQEGDSLRAPWKRLHSAEHNVLLNSMTKRPWRMAESRGEQRVWRGYMYIQHQARNTKVHYQFFSKVCEILGGKQLPTRAILSSSHQTTETKFVPLLTTGSVSLTTCLDIIRPLSPISSFPSHGSQAFGRLTLV